MLSVSLRWYSVMESSTEPLKHEAAIASKFKINSIFIKNQNVFDPFLQVLIREKIMLFAVTAKLSK